MPIPSSRSTIRRRARALVVSIVVAAAAGIATPLDGQQPTAARPCTSPAFRQFDFWLGEWEVRNPQDQVTGTSRITSILGGCVVHERWQGTTGSDGESFNLFDQATGRWHQTWVDNSGLLAQFDGGLSSGGAMVLEGPGRGPNGEPVRSRMTFTPLPGGTVRQLWEYSADSGVTWRTSFDGTYRKRSASGR